MYALSFVSQEIEVTWVDEVAEGLTTVLVALDELTLAVKNYTDAEF